MELSKLIATHNEIAAQAELADLALAYVGLKEWAERFAERRLHGVFQSGGRRRSRKPLRRAL